MKRLSKTKILLIDDDPNIQDLVEDYFKPRGFDMVTHTTAEKALQYMEKSKATCDVILCDLMLPGMTGIEFSKKLKLAGFNKPIIMITATKTVETALEAIQSGAYDFLIKPLNLAQLQVAVERALFLTKIQNENVVLKTAVQLKEGSSPIDGIVGKSPAFLQALDVTKRVAGSMSNVLITGESGTGKEIIAKAIHNLGPRRKGPFVAINCAAIPENLLESELFGHAKGAFTGAIDKKIGLFEEAEGGTLFLDEIGDLSKPLQAKLLRALQEKKIKRIGENQLRSMDVRVLAATHKDLRQEVVQKRFREDLYFRLNVVQIKIPALRDRREDILPLAEFFLTKYAAMNASKVKGFEKDVYERLLSYSWPGNVRELENAIERAVVLCEGSLVNAKDLPEENFVTEALQNPSGQPNFAGVKIDRIFTADEMLKKYIQFVLRRNNGAKEQTARDLNIDRKTLYRKIQEIEDAALGQTK